MWREIVVLATASVMLSGMANAAEITVLATGATQEAYVELVPDFEKSSGHKVTTTWAGSANVKKRIDSGEVYDVVIAPAPMIDSFVEQAKLVPGSRVDVMKSGIGVAVRAGAPKPDILSTGGLKKAVLAATSIGYSTGPSGAYMTNLFDRLGIGDQVKPKLKQVPSGARIGTMIENGEAEIGFQQISELLHAPGIDYIGPLPAEIQYITVFSAGIHTGAKEPELAKALVKSLIAPAAAERIKAHGMEPD